MRIRKRQVPFPLSQVSPDPNRISRSPVMVQLNQAAPADVATSSKRSCTDVSAAAPAHSLDPSQPSDQTLHPPIGEDGELARLPRKKKQEYLVEDEDGKTQEEGEGGQKGNDTRKACNMGSETPPDALSPSSTTCKQDLRWREVEKAIPLKKRRGEFDNNMEGNISDSNRKKTNKIQSRSSRTKMNMAWEQDDDEIIKEEEKEAEEEVVAVDEEEEEEEVEKVRERIQTKKVSKKKRVRGGALMEGSRCSRVNGRGWRCCQPTLVGYSLCEHHLGKGRLRSMTSVRSRSIATPTTAGAPKKLHRQLVPPSDNEAANSSSSYSNNNAKETNCVVARHDDDGYANHHAGGGGEDDHDDEKKPMTVTTKKRVKLGTVKARSISSLLGQTNNEIAMPDNNNNNVN
ncbi:hypothetical protein HN51_027501 [Arachis hypogaea]|uniref:WRC domain-containing protein n=1 Tax=Arachis hypogaea TaxID=3818 RepID=A0A445BMR9_ARAHY|nr:uncharacterized protein LOC112710402 [Arachis hypogaea]QHO33878.1 uncharacterized protein DS421_9g262150 [Arachis hypogaea]RYR39975.1 hypothetical protein Ahy_A09g045623 isoform A [Arachis hypogaea]